MFVLSVAKSQTGYVNDLIHYLSKDHKVTFQQLFDNHDYTDYLFWIEM